MSYRTMFSEAVGRIPPTSIDVDRVITRQRRVVRLRRLGVVAAAAATVGVMTFAVATGTGLPRAEVPAAPTPTTRMSAPDPGQTFTATDTAIFAAVERMAPDLEWVPRSTGGPGWHSGAATTFYTPTGYIGQGSVRSGNRTGELVVEMNPDFGPLPPCTPASTRKNSCAQTSGPGGQKIQTSAVRDQAGPTVSRYVYVPQPGDGILIVSIRGEDEDPPLTIAQLTALALDPAVAEVAADPLRFDGNARRMLTDSAVLYALLREAPKVRGAEGTGPVFSPNDLGASWSGRGGENTADHYWGQGRIMVGKVSGLLSVEIHRRQPGSSGGLSCSGSTDPDACGTDTGPKGERYRTVRSGSGAQALRVVHMLRRDGSWLAVTLAADPKGKFVLTPVQQQAVALDPKVALAAQ